LKTGQKDIHRKIYLVGLVFLALSLPVSTFGMSISQIILFVNWLAEGGFKEKVRILRQNKAIPVFFIFYLIHLLGLGYTIWPEGFYGPGYNGLDDLRIKLPFLILPLVIGTSDPLRFSEIKMLLYSFALTLFGSTLVSSGILFGLFQEEIGSTREISIFISHIRFALLLNIAVFSFAFILYKNFHSSSWNEKLILIVGILWFSVFLILLKSFTGLVIFGLLVFLQGILFVANLKQIRLKKMLFGTLLFVFSFMIFSAYHYVNRYMQFDTYDPSTLDSLTINGNPYVHDFSNIQVENGHWVGLYHQPKELKREWNSRSGMEYNGLDQKGNYIRQTLERYLTALDLRKDSAGLSQLSDEDIRMIERGFANPIYKQKYSPYPRLYEIVWELDLYFRGGNPSGHSVSQRLEYYRTGWLIWKENCWFGVGTGDVDAAYQMAYAENSTRLGSKYQHRSHNQYLSLLVAFGLVGFLFILFSIIFPIYYLKGWRNYLLMVSFLVAFLSMFGEDTLETQAGATFFVFFYSIYLFGSHSEAID
jgi:hypothetical protein